MAAAESARQDIDALYSDHHGWLFAWLRRRLGCAHSAADVAHDTFVRLLGSRDALAALPTLREPRAYLTTTANRLLVDRARRLLLEQRYLAELASESAHAERHHPSPEQIVLALQALEQIAAALERVGPRPREAFLLHYLEDLPQADVARRMGVSVRMVQKYLVQALMGWTRVAGT